MRQDGDLLLSLGTSNVEALLSATYSEMPGICAMARDAAIPGFTLYDAGQAACGDMLAWYMENMLPQAAGIAGARARHFTAYAFERARAAHAA